MSRWLAMVMALASLLWLTPVVAAEGVSLEEQYQQQLEASGADELTGHLPRDVQEMLAQLELDTFDPDSYAGLSFQQVTDLLVELTVHQGGGPLQVMGMLIGVVLVAAVFSGLEGSALSPALRQTYHSAAVLGAGGMLLVPLFALLETVRQTVERVTVFLAAYVPVYAALLATGGRGLGAVSYQATLLGASQLFSWLIQGAVFPVLVVSLAFGCTGSVAEGFCLDRFGQTLHKAVLWTLGLFSTIFSFLLSFQQMAASAGDSLSGRMVRFSLTSFVPVVGGLLGEAYSTVAGCAGLLRSAVGCFGLVAVALVVVPPLIGCVCWSIGLHIAADTAALFRLGPLEKLCHAASGAVRVLIAVLAVSALLMVISTTVITAFSGR